MTELNKTFDPAEIEARWYAHWESTGAFRPARPDATPYTIVMPPPNVTGSLHIGHALDNTLQDILIRYERLRGKDALWVAGTDHAGIATQMVVERQMAERQDKRTNYSREDFISKVWEWKAESGGTITQQLRRLGASCDWTNERFTMDPGFSKAVLKVFVDMYNEGLIYRDKRLVNWDPGLKTAISDLEVETREINGKFWHFRYPLADGARTADGKDYIVVATTRPETMLADMAVAVNAKDERYQSLLAAGAHVVLPITGRRIPIIADDHADPELGSGAVKITPGHDFNDFEVGKRAGIAPAQMLNMLDSDGRVVQVADGLVPAEYIGLYRFGMQGEPTNARKMVVEAIEALGLLDKIEDRVIQTPFGDRSGVVIEPWLTDQWYVDAKTLAGPAIEAVRSGAIKVVPETWAKTWFQWLENIQPWCISRQLWWGHQIPVWYGPDGTVYCAETETDAQAQAGPGIMLTRDPDVLDTWFSSALWPFATLGWPENAPLPLAGGDGGGPIQANQPSESSGSQTLAPTPNPSRERDGDSLLTRHYPNDVLISGFDILFFWDARMAMQGLHQMKQVPWRTLYLHGLVRAADGSKMSKSKGNTVDPLGLIDKYGADALRFFMAAMESQGRDIKMDERRLEGYRNFATKLWNAARFAQANGITASTSVAAPAATLAVNKWIIGEVVETVTALDKALADLRFDEAANVVYHFVWDQFCDWYLELIKAELQHPPRNGEGDHPKDGGGVPEDETAPAAAPPSVSLREPPPRPGEDSLARSETRAVAGWVLDQILVMLHPFMPFITEELWHALADPTHPRDGDLIHAEWVTPEASVDDNVKSDLDWLIAFIREVRSAKNELGISPAARLTAHAVDVSVNILELSQRQFDILARLARIDAVLTDPPQPGASMTIVVHGETFVLPLEGVIDLDAERARLTKAIEAATKEAASLAGRLNNPAFVEKAKPEAVEKARADHAEKSAEAERLQAALARLGWAGLG
jgi:valyl-tRNA synthetase